MQSGPINFSIAKPIFSGHQIEGVRDHAAPRCVPCSPLTNAVDPALTRQITPPLTLHKLSNILHRATSAVTAVLQSRPRPLRLARSVSSRAFFVAFPLPTCRGVSTRASQLHKGEKECQSSKKNIARLECDSCVENWRGASQHE